MKKLAGRIVELIIVFIGVYAAFLLNGYQTHKQDHQRRHQILIYLAKQATTSSEKLRQVTLNYDERMNAFLTQLGRSQMPEISPIAWATNYNANETNWILQGGGLELLDIATIAKLKEVDSAASTGLSTMAHYQQLSDQLIVPHLGEDRNFFYDPATRQLRKQYALYPEILKEGSRVLHELLGKTDQLVAQLRAEQAQHP